MGDRDGVHPWYMMLRRFSSRSARKWADLAARVKRVVAVLSIGFGSKESGGACGPWVAFRVRLESIASSTAAENWAMMSQGGRGTDELELPLCDCQRSGRSTNRLLADCNSGFEVGYRSVPTVHCTDGTERLHYNTLKGYPVSTSGGMSPAPLSSLSYNVSIQLTLYERFPILAWQCPCVRVLSAVARCPPGSGRALMPARGWERERLGSR